MFFRQLPTAEAMQTLHAAVSGSERVHLDDRQLYVSLPDGILDSKLTNALMGARFSKLTTGRNWNTVLKLGALAGL